MIQKIFNAQKDTEIWVYDDGSLNENNDDYAHIKVVKNIVVISFIKIPKGTDHKIIFAIRSNVIVKIINFYSQ